MLLIPVRVGPSRVHGTGIFALTTLRARTPIWRFQTGFDRTFSAAEWASLPTPAREFLRAYCYYDRCRSELVLNADHGRFMNHAAAPNTGADPHAAPGSWPSDFITVALSDLPAGTELTCNYSAFDGDVAWKLGQVADDAPLGAATTDLVSQSESGGR